MFELTLIFLIVSLTGVYRHYHSVRKKLFPLHLPVRCDWTVTKQFCFRSPHRNTFTCILTFSRSLYSIASVWGSFWSAQIVSIGFVIVQIICSPSHIHTDTAVSYVITTLYSSMSYVCATFCFLSIPPLFCSIQKFIGCTFPTPIINYLISHGTNIVLQKNLRKRTDCDLYNQLYTPSSPRRFRTQQFPLSVNRFREFIPFHLFIIFC